ncbi:argininosuccinate lyase [Roseisolibacter sp. H3M3-2]|uniref:argininosuccinate lyase n=1 Tax=Roseisolibacter sp. H3M3-2 TaxID=3031323 RepID=UPI0023DA2744|nr:argininosuccinate lyase [Roseisolibacter sp. H3M3-2]MDF1501921.1 argininosuccinate lyase [Roseisolibacter sp. H3M3-2]
MSESGGAHKLWGGRFAGGPSPLLEAINRSIGVDFRLWPHDVRLSKAWAVALGHAGVLTLDESRELERGLDVVARQIADGAQPVASDEDVHTMIDRLLHDAVGSVASRLHTGRSRNDQVATATRLWTIDACGKVDVALRGVQQVLLARAEELRDALMPAYTHLQRAQPVSVAHWLLSHFWPLERDRRRLQAAARGASELPLGSGAIAGSAFPVSRLLLKESLGFHAVARNSIDAVGDRDFVAEAIFAMTMAGTHLSRLAEDLILFGSSEFGFVRFGDGFSTGSSMMPQKRNPDALELARGSAARLLGDLVSMLGALKGLPTGYNKDLQDDKRALFDAVDTMLLVAPAVAGTVDELRFDTARMEAALSSSMMATDLADYLVRKGATFRESHGAVGSLVRQAEERGIEMTALPPEAFAAAHPLFGDDARDALGARASVAHREAIGGTGPKAVAEQIEAARATLAPVIHETPAHGNQLIANVVAV